MDHICRLASLLQILLYPSLPRQVQLELYSCHIYFERRTSLVIKYVLLKHGMPFSQFSFPSSPKILPLTYFPSTVSALRSLLNVYEVFHFLSQLRNHVVHTAVCFIILPTHLLKSFTCLCQTTPVVHSLLGSCRTSQPRL